MKITKYNDVINEYFEKNSNFFKNFASKAIFLEGALVGLLLETQRINNPEKKGNEAFWSSLRNLRVNERIIRSLFPKIVSKLKNLGKSYSGFVSEVSNYLQESGMNWDLTNLEISWYFTHGIASYRNLKPKKKTKKDDVL